MKRMMQGNPRCRTVFLLLLLDHFVPSSSSGSVSDYVVQSHASSARNLLQAKKACPVNFEFLNYTIITSQCKGPDYPPDRCCSAFKDFACPYADVLNDGTNDCSEIMFNYISLHGKYPAGLFASECREGKEGLACPPTPSQSDNLSGSQITCVPPRMLMLAFGFLATLLKLFRREIMSHYQGDDAEYIADEYEMKNVDDEMDEELHNKEMGLDSDVDEYDHMNNKVADTSAAQARRGKDIQGIPWDRLSTTREKYRQTRLEQYKNYENIPYSGEDSGKDCKASKKGGLYYEFRSNSRSVKPTVFHFQHTSVSPDGKLIIIVGDNPDGMLVDSSTGKTVMPLCGHLDFSFASAWHPDGVTFATGNQDKTSQIWDARNLSKSVAVLKGNLGAIRSIHYTSDGQNYS